MRERPGANPSDNSSQEQYRPLTTLNAPVAGLQTRHRHVCQPARPFSCLTEIGGEAKENRGEPESTAFDWTMPISRPWNRILRPVKQEKPRNGPRNRLFKPETRFPCPSGNENGILTPKSSKKRRTGMINAVSFPNQPERQFFSGTFSAPEGPQRACRGITNPPQARLSACKAVPVPDRNRWRGNGYRNQCLKDLSIFDGRKKLPQQGSIESSIAQRPLFFNFALLNLKMELRAVAPPYL